LKKTETEAKLTMESIVPRRIASTSQTSFDRRQSDAPHSANEQQARLLETTTRSAAASLDARKQKMDSFRNYSHLKEEHSVLLQPEQPDAEPSMRNKYSEQLIKTFESRALAKM
jgi:hypothetical protein